MDEFIVHLRVERNLSPRTITAYASDLAGFCDWAEREGVHPLDADHRRLRRYLAELDRPATPDAPWHVALRLCVPSIGIWSRVDI